MLVLHYTGMDDDAQALDWLCNTESEVSAHYYVHRDGSILQLVDEGARAWHAGQSFWKGETDINSCSIGIEIANAGHEDFPKAQLEAVIALAKDIAERHDIAPYRILAHSDVSPGRKIDPGAKFPWDALCQNLGLGIGLSRKRSLAVAFSKKAMKVSQYRPCRACSRCSDMMRRLRGSSMIRPKRPFRRSNCIFGKKRSMASLTPRPSQRFIS